MNPTKARYTGYRLPSDGGLSLLQRRADIAKRATFNAGGKQTNAVFASSDPAFLAACETGEVKPTPRQASKFRRKRGLAFAQYLRTRNRAA